MRRLRFLVFNVTAWFFVLVHGPLVLLSRPLGARVSYAIARNWCVLVRFLVRHICGLTYRVEGREHMPDEAAVMFIKHSSAFETFVQLIEFPRACWVLKKELLYVPFFGWALWVLRAIAIDRAAGGAAVKQVVRQGTERLEEGISVSIFPEGTRMAPGETRRYGISGTLLAQQSGRPIVPIAHNAGYHWPRRARAITPGEVVFVIGPPVDPRGRDLREVNDEIQTWMENEVARIVG
jgi:1-acyl-sn-glycerol-3-phosphate acyltransferase